ncbi:MAG: efflux RND transporter periplasmic adaptor subunit [Myxococcales bacterium]|nr:efflux RND transporter periplasmic adaptor subunit [Myxococcales bacterium]
MPDRTLLLTFGGLVVLAGCRSSKHHEPEDHLPASRAVHAEPARMVTRMVGEEVIGTVRARDTVELSPTVMGKLAELHCVLGSRVKAGDVIARLSVQELNARLDQARETLAQADLELARVTRLHASGALPGADYDAAVSRHRIAEAARAEAAAMAGYATMRAPFAGVVTAKLANAGDMAMPGKPVCVIEDPSSLRFEATVPENLARAFEHAPGIQVRLDVIDAAITATVAEISPNADAISRTVLVKLALPPDPRLRAGAFGRATVPASEVHALTVPVRAVVRHGQLEAVYVVADGAARMRLVRTGRSAEERIELRSGVRDGELVVIDAPDALVDGQPVTVTR